MPQRIPLPYFDILLGELAQGKRDIATAFGRHVHWGYWADTSRATGTMSDFAAAAERMSERVADAAKVRDGHRVLDAGCGFGGTVANIDERCRDVDLVGLNIDGRQLERARATVRPREGNRIDFVEGDACELPFDDASFDAVLAVECIFHFPSRRRFFEEARRVLKPGGRLSICDVVPSVRGAKLLGTKSLVFGSYVERFVGPNDVSTTVDEYHVLARETRLRSVHEEDVTRNTLPTYPVLRHIARETGQHVTTAVWGTGAMEWLSRLGLLRYAILAFEKPKAG